MLWERWGHSGLVADRRGTDVACGDGWQERSRGTSGIGQRHSSLPRQTDGYNLGPGGCEKPIADHQGGAVD
jgi:hypothetical protein